MFAAALVLVEPGGYALLPANQDLTAAEVILLQARGQGGESKLRKALQSLRNSFDVILVVCPPSLTVGATPQEHPGTCPPAAG